MADQRERKPMNINPVPLRRDVWAYPSRSGKSLEIFVRGESAATVMTTHSFRITFSKLEKIRKVVRRG